MIISVSHLDHHLFLLSRGLLVDGVTGTNDMTLRVLRQTRTTFSYYKVETLIICLVRHWLLPSAGIYVLSNINTMLIVSLV